MALFCSNASVPANEAGFLRAASPVLQAAFANNLRKTYLEPAPTLDEIQRAYSPKFAANWVALQLDAVLKAAGSKDNITQADIHVVALDIIANYKWLTAPELMVFCSRCKSGYYGKLVYGREITIDDVVSKLPAYLSDRVYESQRCIRQREAEREEREAAEHASKCVTYEEAKAIIARAAAGDPEARHLLHDNPENWS